MTAMPTDQFDSLTGHAARHDALDDAIAAPTFVSATAPGDPAEGATWLDTSGTPTLKVWVDGSPGSWVTVGGGGGGAAEDITYDGTTSGLAATDVQAAIDELEGLIPTGLANFTESVNTSAPNATVPVVQLLATNAATNVDVALTPKGTGAIMAQVPDGTIVGGNKRGTNAVDLQTAARSSAVMVASGINSVISGGDTNRASGTRSTVSGGTNNNATATNSTVGGGSGNTASGSSSVVSGGSFNTASAQESTISGGTANGASANFATVGGGNSNSASGAQSTVAGGQSNTASGISSWVPGGAHGLTRGLFAAYAWSGERRSSQGDNQCFGLPVQRGTTDATPTILTADRVAPSTTNVMVLPNNSCWTGTVHITGRSSGADLYYLRLDVVGARGANAAATTVKATNPAYTFTDTGLVGVSAAVIANTTRGSLEVEVTGLAATTIDWFAHFVAGNQIVR